jgi:hypothetical protein
MGGRQFRKPRRKSKIAVSEPLSSTVFTGKVPVNAPNGPLRLIGLALWNWKTVVPVVLLLYGFGGSALYSQDYSGASGFFTFASCLLGAKAIFCEEVRNRSDRHSIRGLVAVMTAVLVLGPLGWVSIRARAHRATVQLPKKESPATSPAVLGATANPIATQSREPIPADHGKRPHTRRLAPTNEVGPIKIVNNAIDGNGIQVLGNSKDVEIRRNEIYNANVGFRNAGKANGVFLEDNEVHAPKNGTAALLDNLSTGKMSNVIARKNRITGEAEEKASDPPSAPTRP